MVREQLLLFDLDGTLLRDDKTISQFSLGVLEKCRGSGILLGVATARSEKNACKFIEEINLDIVISSGGALVKFREKCIFNADFSPEETREIIFTARQRCGGQCKITVDTIDEHYCNYHDDMENALMRWGDSVYTDYGEFNSNALKICVETSDYEAARKIANAVSECDMARFSGSDWYKYSKVTATKGNAVREIEKKLKIKPERIIAFGDDYVDIEMLQLCGLGVAVENSIQEVKAVADRVIQSNNDDGVAKFLAGKYGFKY